MKLTRKIKELSSKDRIIYANILGAFAVKGAALFISLYTMPAYMRYFSDQQVLGVWFTLLSILSWVLNFDLGIGNGLRNKLTAALTMNDRKSAKEYIASAYWMIGLIVAAITVAGCSVLNFVNWNSVFNLDRSIVSAQSLEVAVQYTFIGIMMQFFLRLVSSILYAMQRSAVNNGIALVTSVLQLVFVLLAPSTTPEENLRSLSAAYILCANLPLLIATLVIFSGSLKDCRPALGSVNKEKAKAVLSLGGLFFVCQILFMGIANTNEFFITRYCGPGDVVSYQIYNKLFTLAGTLFMLALTPVWSAVSRAITEKDYRWLKKLSTTLIKLSCLAMLAEFMIIPMLPLLLKIWLGEEAIAVNYIYAVCFAVFGSAMVFQSAISTIVNGMGRMKTQAICYGIGMVVKVVMIHFGVAYFGNWIIVVAANTVILIPYCIIQYAEVQKIIANNLGD